MVNESEQPEIRITDKRRFAREAPGPDAELPVDVDAEAPGPDAELPVDVDAEAPGPDAELPVDVDAEALVTDSGSDSPPPGAGTDDLDAERARADEYLGHLQRLQAEFDNYRKRVLKEQTQSLELAAEPVMRRLLEVLDDFELALMAANDKPDFDRFLHGVELVFAKFLDSLKAEGLARIEAEAKPFDPERHEAMMQTGEAEGEPFVADVLRPGYTLRGRVLRPAGVRVERK